MSNTERLLAVIHRYRAAVEKFLAASGHDLCHENRAELAKVFGLAPGRPELPPESEFEQRCVLYRKEVYHGATTGAEARSAPDSPGPQPGGVAGGG